MPFTSKIALESLSSPMQKVGLDWMGADELSRAIFDDDEEEGIYVILHMMASNGGKGRKAYILFKCQSALMQCLLPSF